jgi:hypothetical protein
LDVSGKNQERAGKNGISEMSVTYSSPNITQELNHEHGPDPQNVEESINVYKMLVDKHAGSGSFGKTKLKWQVNTKTDLEELRFECIKWMQLALGTAHIR